MIVLARKRGGQCISMRYVNSSFPLLWKCARGHQWWAVPASIRKGSWCPECAGVRRLTLGQMDEIAKSRGGRCVSDYYRNSATKLAWQCSKGHEWSAPPLQIKKGHWCPYCARVAPLNLAILKGMAAQKGGFCLSPVYVNSSGPVRWKCSVGHEWVASAHSVRDGNWCGVCAHNQKLKLEELQKIAKERGGMCLSNTYKNGSTRLVWLCKFGHCWKAAAASVKGGARRKGSWCMECYRFRRRFHGKQNLEAMSSLAISRGGACLAATYLGSKVKLTWECKFGHRWNALPSSVVQGTWCPVCARNQRLSLRIFQDLATKRGGTCLSQIYLNERFVLRWRCANGHEWETAPAKIRRGAWCPKCANDRRRGDWIVVAEQYKALASTHIDSTRLHMRPAEIRCSRP